MFSHTPAPKLIIYFKFPNINANQTSIQ